MIRVQHLDSGSSLTLAQRTPGEDDPALTIVIGGGRGCVLRIGSPMLGVWVPLRPEPWRRNTGLSAAHSAQRRTSSLVVGGLV